MPFAGALISAARISEVTLQETRPIEKRPLEKRTRRGCIRLLSGSFCVIQIIH